MPPAVGSDKPPVRGKTSPYGFFVKVDFFIADIEI
jgi:hypothetical protein